MNHTSHLDNSAVKSSYLKHCPQNVFFHSFWCMLWCIIVHAVTASPLFLKYFHFLKLQVLHPYEVLLKGLRKKD